MKITKSTCAYINTIFFISLSISLFVPVTALFLSEEVKVNNLQIGLFFTIEALFSIFFNQLLAKYSDIKGSRKDIIIFGCVCGMLSCAAFSYFRNYYVLLFIAIFIFSFSHIGGQVFAAAREYCIYTKRNVITFTSIMRAFFALAWVVGPPLALICVENYGYATVYLCCSFVYFSNVIVSYFFLHPTKVERDASEIKKIKLFENNSVLFLFLSIILVFVCNQSYLITMPQYIYHELGIEKKYAGIFMATAALFEMPIMIISGQLAKKIHIKNLLLVATFSGCIYYITIFNVTELWAFWSAQIVNSIFIGIITSLGMVYFQELLPKVPGQATTLFTNAVAIGVTIAGGLCGFIAQYLGFSAVFISTILLSLVSFIFMCMVKKN